MIGAQESDRFLLCRIGTALGALALSDVREIMRPLPVEPLMSPPSFVLGLALIRGMPTPVIDAARLLGAHAVPSSASGPSPFGRFVSLKVGERTAALAVDAVLDIRAIGAALLADIPPLLRATEAGLVSTLGALDARLLLVLEAARLVPESVWSMIEAPEASA
jgi:purine-binding chemotaxis protein CheW